MVITDPTEYYFVFLVIRRKEMTWNAIIRCCNRLKNISNRSISHIDKICVIYDLDISIVMHHSMFRPHFYRIYIYDYYIYVTSHYLNIISKLFIYITF
jgi:hypothetical protein